jgi:apolipoprotein N-acyltransferase
MNRDAWARVEAGLRAAAGKHPFLLCFAAGGVSTLAMAPAKLWPVLFLTIPCLAAAIDAAVCRRGQIGSRAVFFRAALSGWMFGFGYFLLGIYWISASLFVDPGKFLWLLPFSATLMPAGLAIFFAVGTLVAAVFWRPGPAGALALAIGLAISEWLRGQVLTGFPWNTLGYALTNDLWLMQWAALVGVNALTLIVVLLAAIALRMPERTIGAKAFALPAVALAAMWMVGALRVGPVADVAGVRLRVLQPNVSQDVKWRYENRAQIFARYIELSRADAGGRRDDLDGITHVVWPESAVPFLLLNAPDALESIGAMLGKKRLLLTGAVRLEAPAASGQPRKVYNSILALGEGGRLVGVYDKLHLVPFGEYVPFREVFDLLGLGSFTPAEQGFAFGQPGNRVLTLPGLPPALALICYEIIFPAEARAVEQRPGVILNVTNDGWFRSTAGPHQHLHQARVRAVELGLPLVRSANTGISAVIDPYGRIIRSAALGTSAVFDSPLPAALAPTPYSRRGELFFGLLLAGAGIGWLWLSGVSKWRRST